jgi:hypothetical protein
VNGREHREDIESTVSQRPFRIFSATGRD